MVRHQRRAVPENWKYAFVGPAGPLAGTQSGQSAYRFGLSDGWVPVELKRDVEYPEMLEGVVNSLKHIAGVIKDAMPDA